MQLDPSEEYCVAALKSRQRGSNAIQLDEIQDRRYVTPVRVLVSLPRTTVRDLCRGVLMISEI